MDVTPSKRDIIHAENEKCSCEKGIHVILWSGWVTDDTRGFKVYCRGCNSLWDEI